MGAFETAKKGIIDWLKSGSGLDSNHVIWTDQDLVKPTKPFLKARLKSFTRKGLPSIHEPDASGHGSVVTHNNFTLSLTYYGSTGSKDSMGALLDLGDKLTHQGKLAILQAAGVAYVAELMGPTDACVVVDANWEDRAAMDLWMRMPWVSTDNDQGFITAVSAEGAMLSVEGVSISVGGISVTVTP